MTILKAIWLGIIQGLTEFLPVSSSGHLKIFAEIFETNFENQQAFDVAVHFATLLAVMLVYRKKYVDVAQGACTAIVHREEQSLKQIITKNDHIRTIICVIIATIPTGIIGLCLKDKVKGLPLTVVGCALFGTALILLLPKLTGKANQEGIPRLSYFSAFLLGLAQSFAILPGISRSGTTITVAILLGASRSYAGFFSFLIMIPAVAGATVLNLKHFGDMQFSILFAGFMASFISGYIALTLLLKLLDKGKFHFFSPYCFLLGTVVLLKIFELI